MLILNQSILTVNSLCSSLNAIEYHMIDWWIIIIFSSIKKNYQIFKPRTLPFLVYLLWNSEKYSQILIGHFNLLNWNLNPNYLFLIILITVFKLDLVSSLFVPTRSSKNNIIETFQFNHRKKSIIIIFWWINLVLNLIILQNLYHRGFLSL